MTAGRPSDGRRHGASLGQIPLSSGEIELYSRQDETARRRHRLLAVREQERRLAQQVTKRYRANLQQLQSHKARKTQKQLSVEQEKMLTELHRRYQNSLQSMGTAQRNARGKLLELMEKAQLEQLKWTYNRQVTGRQRMEEAQEAQEEEETQRLARRRQVEQNLQRLKELSGKQRAQANARARQEQDMVLQRIKEREEIEKLRRVNSPEEVFVTPRPHAEDIQSYRFTRAHCFVPPVPVVVPGVARPAVTVIKHNRKHPTAMHGVEEASKYREETDQKRERDRLVMEEQGETAAERGKTALDNVTSRQKGQQALEWLALVDKMERRERGIYVEGGDDNPLDAEGRAEDPEKMAERAFAELLGLGDESIDLSVFSIETDEEDQSVGLPETDQVGGDNAAKANADYKAKIKPDSFGPFDETKPGKSKPIVTGERAKATRDNVGLPMKTNASGDLKTRSKSKMKRGKDMSPEYIEVPLKPDRGEESGEQPDKVRKAKGDWLDSDVEEDNSVLQSGERFKSVRKGYQTRSAPLGDKRTPTSRRSGRRYSYASIEERPEGIDNEEEDASQLSRDNDSIERQENRVEDALDFGVSKLRQGRPLNAAQRQHGPTLSLSSGSEVGEGVLELGKTTMGSTTRRQRPPISRESFSSSDGPQDVSALSVALDESESISPRSGASGEMSASVGYQSASSVNDRSEMGNEGFFQADHLGAARLGSSGASLASSMDRDKRDEETILRRAPAGPSSAQTHTRNDIRHRDDVTNSARSFVRGDNFDDVNLPWSSATPVRPSVHAQRSDGAYYHDEAGHQEIDAGSESHEPRYPDTMTSQREEDRVLHQSDVSDQVPASPTLGEGNVLRQSDHANQITTSPMLEHDEGRLLSARLAEDEESSPSEQPVIAGHEEIQPKAYALGSKDSHAMSVDQDDLSSSGSFAPSQKSLSRLQPDTNKLVQRFFDEHMLSFSSSEGMAEDNEDDIHLRSVGPGIANPSVNLNPYDRYRRQIDHQARRSSTSASSVAQYSLPPSETHSSFDDNLDRLQPGHGEDSFVNELVPMFPKRTIPQSLDEDDQALEQYDVQLVAPNMSRMLTAEQRSSLGRSRQQAARLKPPATPDTRRQSSTPKTRHVEEYGDKRSRIERRMAQSSSGHSSSVSSEHDMNERSGNLSPMQQRSRVRPTLHVPTRATGGVRSQIHHSIDADSLENDATDGRSEISESDSGVSSLGFTVQLHLAAGTARRRDDGEVQSAGSSHGNTPQSLHSEPDAFFNVEHGRQSNDSERSFVSDSSMSMDAHFNYLANMRSGVEKSVPLHLRFPAMIYGKKDMTKPPAPMSWSSSSVSSVADESHEDRSAAPGNISHFERRRISHSSMSESLEEQNVPSPRLIQVQGRESERDASDGELGHKFSVGQSADGSSNIENAGETETEAERTQRTAFDSIKEKVVLLPPPPLGSLDMSQPPAPLQNLDRSFGDSHSSLAERSETTERDHAHRHHKRRLYEAEEERKLSDSSSESGASLSDGSLGSSISNSRGHSNKRAERMDIPLEEAKDDENGRSDAGEKVSLAEAFQRRHPRFRDRIESQRDKLKRQREKQHEQQQREQEEVGPNAGAKRSAKTSDKVAQRPPGHDAIGSKTPLSQPEQALLNRLATGSRAKISSREMKERSRRLYHQLPEVVERKRQEEMLRRRRQRLDELREQEKERRLQQKQRRQHQLQHKA